MDFVMKAGTPKATIVRNVKNQEPYSPATDYYRQIREGLAQYVAGDITKARLQSIAKNTAPAKVVNYNAMVKGFLKWHKPEYKSIAAPRAVWKFNTVSVQVNPELAFKTDDGYMAVKLYFKADPLKKQMSDVLLELMTSTLNVAGGRSFTCVVLDVRKAKEWSAQGSRPSLAAQLQAEGAYWEVLWKSL